MSKTFSLQPLLDIMQTRADDATRELGRLISEEQNAKSRLMLLEQYRQEYAQKLTNALGEGLSPSAWQNYQNFLIRLDEAIASQQAMVDASARNTEAGQAHWKTQNSKLKAIDTLSQRHETRELHRQNKQEQKLLDEFCTRKYGAGGSEGT